MPRNIWNAAQILCCWVKAKKRSVNWWIIWNITSPLLPVNDAGIKNDSELYKIQSLAYLHDGKTIKTPTRPVIKNLDALPFPAWDLVDRDKYRAIWMEHHGYYSMNLVTTRGCPFHCNWCAKPIWGQKYNVRSAQNVVEEMAWLKENFAPDQIWFMDDIMGIQDKWIEEFADLLDARKSAYPLQEPESRRSAAAGQDDSRR